MRFTTARATLIITLGCAILYATLAVCRSVHVRVEWRPQLTREELVASAAAKFFLEAPHTTSTSVTLMSETEVATLDRAVDAAVLKFAGSKGALVNVVDHHSFPALDQYAVFVRSRGWDCQTLHGGAYYCAPFANVQADSNGTTAEIFMHLYQDPETRLAFREKELASMRAQFDEEVQRSAGVRDAVRFFLSFSEKDVYLDEFLPSVETTWVCDNSEEKPRKYTAWMNCAPSPEVIAAVREEFVSVVV